MTASFNKNGIVSSSIIEGYDKLSILKDNIIQNQNLVPSSWNSNNKCSTASCTGTGEMVADSKAAGGYHYVCTATAAGTGGFHFPVWSKTSDKIGKTYTWSCWIKGSKARTRNVGHECGGTMSCTLTTEWQYFSKTWTYTDATYSSFVFYGGFDEGEKLYIKDFKIEEGSVATLWCPNSADGYGTINQITINNPISMNEIIEY